jgi:hypothetical protein
MGFCMLGLLKSLLGKDSNPVAFPSLIIFFVASYMFASWWAPTLAGSYGNRGFIDFYGVFAVGLGVFLSPIVKNLTLKNSLGIALVGLILTGSNFHRMSQYWRNVLPFGYVSESLFWKTMNRW